MTGVTYHVTILLVSTAVIIHVVGSMVALTLGPFLFLPGLRTRRPALHRWLGCVYLVSNLVGGRAGLYMSTFGYGSAMTQIDFASLGLLWLITGAMAYGRIRAGKVAVAEQAALSNAVDLSTQEVEIAQIMVLGPTPEKLQRRPFCHWGQSRITPVTPTARLASMTGARR